MGCAKKKKKKKKIKKKFFEEQKTADQTNKKKKTYYSKEILKKILCFDRRFVLENTDQGNALNPGSKGVALVAKDQECRAKFDAIASDITNDLEEYRVYMAAEKIYHYLWDEFAANILEESKHIFKTGTPEEAASRKRLLMSVLSDSLKLLHPFMPFITEEIWWSLPDTKELLMVAPWPQNREKTSPKRRELVFF